MSETRTADLEADRFEIQFHRKTRRKQLVGALAVFLLCGFVGFFFGAIPWIIGFFIFLGIAASANGHGRKARALEATMGKR